MLLLANYNVSNNVVSMVDYLSLVMMLKANSLMWVFFVFFVLFDYIVMVGAYMMFFVVCELVDQLRAKVMVVKQIALALTQ